MIPTETPTPDLTIIPTSTPTPTITPLPTSTPTVEPTPEVVIVSTGPIATAKTPLRLGRQETLLEGGFSYKAPVGYTTLEQTYQVTMTSDDEDTVFSLLGGNFEREEVLQLDFEKFVNIIANQPSLVDFGTEMPHDYQVDGILGLAADISGLYGENEITGRILVVAPAEDRIFYALAISPDNDTGEGWEPEGRQAFEAVLRTVKFFEPAHPDE